MHLFAAGTPRIDRLKIGYASITGNRISLWVAQDKGFFTRQGLQPELIFIASSAAGIPALIAGEMAIFSGSPETAAQAAAGGADLVIIASAEPVGCRAAGDHSLPSGSRYGLKLIDLSDGETTDNL